MSKRETESSEERDRNADVFSQAVEALRRGEVIVFPTETFYGLGADALNPAAVDKIFLLKGRNPDNPIPLIIADRAMLEEVVREFPPAAQRLADRFWPGPLTLVLPAKARLPAPLLNRDGGVGVRVSSHPLARRLSRELGRPITATSANLSGRPPARSIAEALTYFSEKLTVYLDGGALQGRKGSTVIEVREGKLRTVREGEIGAAEIEACLAG
ncbi:MAG: threonylcarbamoyl-AMP synthase [Deltaproteobacteria bacterium RIFCSPLOWO2_12_FULL_60_19]|nr:MAG: threonylcarbamoyl-AMP synthase [Deltaproteobacteria bacterium RIFCSPLOWO2_12_FULL_60_19]